MKNSTATKAPKTVSVKAGAKSLTIRNNITGATVILKVEDGKIVRDLASCETRHDYQYGNNIAVFVGALLTKYISKRLSWADRLKKIEKASAKIDAKSIRNMSNKLRVTLNPVFVKDEANFYFAEVCAANKA